MVAVQEVVVTPVVTEAMDHPWTEVMEALIATALLTGDILVIEATATGYCFFVVVVVVKVKFINWSFKQFSKDIWDQ